MGKEKKVQRMTKIFVKSALIFFVIETINFTIKTRCLICQIQTLYEMWKETGRC